MVMPGLPFVLPHRRVSHSPRQIVNLHPMRAVLISRARAATRRLRRCVVKVAFSVHVYVGTAAMADKNFGQIRDPLFYLKNRFDAVFEAICAKQMVRLGNACWFLQTVSHRRTLPSRDLFN